MVRLRPVIRVCVAVIVISIYTIAKSTGEYLLTSVLARLSKGSS